MLPMKALRLGIGDDFAASAFLSQAANENTISLVKDPFVAEETLVAADLTYADFDGGTPKDVGLNDQLVGIDPVTGDQRVTLIEPVGGWRWETSGVTNLPQTIYGFALRDAAGTTLLAVETLATPITLTEAGQEINLGTVKFDFVPQPTE
jgi:hypothetical protein